MSVSLSEDLSKLEVLKMSVQQATRDYVEQRKLVNDNTEQNPERYSYALIQSANQLLSLRQRLWESSIALKRLYDIESRKGNNDKTVLEILKPAGEALQETPITKEMTYIEFSYEPDSYDRGQDAVYPGERIETTKYIFSIGPSQNSEMSSQGKVFHENIEKVGEAPIMKMLALYSDQKKFSAEYYEKKGYHPNKDEAHQMKAISRELKFIKEHPPREKINGKIVVDELKLIQLTSGCILKHIEEVRPHRKNKRLYETLCTMLDNEEMKLKINSNLQEPDQIAYAEFMQKYRFPVISKNELNKFNKLIAQVEEAQKKYNVLLVKVNGAEKINNHDVRRFLSARAELLKVSIVLNNKIKTEPKYYNPETHKLLENVVIMLKKPIMHEEYFKKKSGEYNQAKNKEADKFKDSIKKMVDYVATSEILRGVVDNYGKGQLATDYLRKKHPPEKGGFLNGMQNAFNRKSLAAKLPDEITDIQIMLRKISDKYPVDKDLQAQLPVIRGYLLTQIDKAEAPSKKILKQVLTALLENPKMEKVNNDEDRKAYKDYQLVAAAGSVPQATRLKT
jgi:hypothetical protein